MVRTIGRWPGSICLRNRLTVERYGRRAAALPHSSNTKLLVTKSARQRSNSEKHARAARCHWSLSSQTAKSPTVSRKAVTAGVHYGGTPHRVRLIGKLRTISRKCCPDVGCDLPVAQRGVAQIPLRCAPAIRLFPVVEKRRLHRLHGSFSRSSFTSEMAGMPAMFAVTAYVRSRNKVP